MGGSPQTLAPSNRMQMLADFSGLPAEEKAKVISQLPQGHILRDFDALPPNEQQKVMSLPPGATLVSGEVPSATSGMKLPPGAVLVSADRTLASRIRQKYPGAYDDLSDSELESRMLAKYPQYQDLASPATQTRQATESLGASQITGMSAQPQPTGWRDSVAKWADNVMNDIKYGTDITGIGTVVKKMGAHGVYNGNPEAVGDFMASLPLGLARTAKGAAEVTQEPWQGTKDIVGGASQAAAIPSAFMGGQAAGTAAGTAAEAVTTAGSKVFGSVEKAGQLFDKVKSAAAGVEVPITDEMTAAINQAKQLSATGAKGLPRVVTKFFNRINNSDEPLTWDEARMFYSNVSRLSANEYQSMNPSMARAVGKFAGAFNNTLRTTAEAAGVGDDYAQAMSLYARSKAWQQFGSDAWSFIKKAAPYALGAGAGSKLAIRYLSDLLPGQ